jgi:lysozyme family protein
MATFRKSQQIVGLNEGGYQDDPRDSGNYYHGQ